MSRFKQGQQVVYVKKTPNVSSDGPRKGQIVPGPKFNDIVIVDLYSQKYPDSMSSHKTTTGIS